MKLWNSGQFSTAELMYRRALGHGCRTKNASIADLFFVPACSGALRASPVSAGEHCVVRVPKERVAASALLELLREVAAPTCNGRNAPPCSVLEARGGADHILVNPRRAYFEGHPFAELDYLDPRFGAFAARDRGASARQVGLVRPVPPTRCTMACPTSAWCTLSRDQLAAAPWRVQHDRPSSSSVRLAFMAPERCSVSALPSAAAVKPPLRATASSWSHPT